MRWKPACQFVVVSVSVGLLLAVAQVSCRCGAEHKPPPFASGVVGHIEKSAARIDYVALLSGEPNNAKSFASATWRAVSKTGEFQIEVQAGTYFLCAVTVGGGRVTGLDGPCTQISTSKRHPVLRVECCDARGRWKTH